MRILFGIQGTGNGHVARSREVVAALKARGHAVHVLVSGRPLAAFWRDPVLEPYEERKGLTFHTHDGRISYLSTLRGVDPVSLVRDVRAFDASGFDLVISDFEPITARVARRFRLPSLGIGHQYAFRYPVPVAGGDPLARLMLARFAPVDHPIGLHWHHFGSPIFPPIVARDVALAREPVPGKVLVYLPHANRDALLALLARLDDHRFHVYDDVSRAVDRGNVRVEPFSRDGLLVDLNECVGVVCHAGFELPSEALHLGKRLLVVPVGRQLEQRSNALALERLGLARAATRLEAGALREWLTERPRPSAPYPDVAESIAELIDAGRWASPDQAVRAAWGAL